ncbi:hypothetical protein MYXA107069_28405 [Myxococcus xanthus]
MSSRVRGESSTTRMRRRRASGPGSTDGGGRGKALPWWALAVRKAAESTMARRPSARDVAPVRWPKRPRMPFKGRMAWTRSSRTRSTTSAAAPLWLFTTRASSPSRAGRGGSSPNSDDSGASGRTRPSTRSDGRPATSHCSAESTFSARETWVALRASVSVPTWMKSSGATVRETGTRSSKMVPQPGADSTPTSPPRAWMEVRTASNPTPRPDRSVTTSREVKPGRKMSSRAAASDRALAALSSNSPLRTATLRSWTGSTPMPSSSTRRLMRLPSRAARSVRQPRGFLSAVTRSTRVSSPWSRALRTRCINGSRSASTTARSARVSSPSTTSSTSLPSARDRSRTMRG